MEFTRGLVSATLLTVWAGTIALWGFFPTSGWTFLLVALAGMAWIGWWTHLKNLPAPPVSRREYHPSKPKKYGWDDPHLNRGDRD